MKLLIFIFLIFPLTASAQLSQLEFDDKAKAKAAAAKSSAANSSAAPEVVNQIIEEEQKVPKTAAEAEAMERAALEKLKNKNSNSSSSAMSSSVVSSAAASSSSSEDAAKYNYTGGFVALTSQHGCAFIPPRLKGPFVDDGNDSSITSKESWPIPKNKDCGSVSDEKSYISKALALKELLYRFSGNTDYVDLASSNVCAKHCQEGFHLTAPSDLRIEQGPGATFSVAVIGNSCHYILEKPKDKPWKLIKALGMVCNCFELGHAKTAFDSQVLENK